MRSRATQSSIIGLGATLALAGAAAGQEPHFFGLPHRELGQGRLEPTPGGLLITGIGTTGQDGVSVGLNESQFHIVRFDPGPASSLPDGAYTEFAVRGVVDGRPDSFVWALRATDIGDRFGLSFDTSTVLPRQLRLEARLEGRLILDRLIAPPDPREVILRFRPEGCWIDPFWPMGPECWAIVGFPSPAPVEFPGGPTVLADEVIIATISQQAVVGTLSATELRARAVPSILILDEALGLFEFEHRSRGQSHLLADSGALTVSNIGSSGQDGLRIEWHETTGASLGFSAELEPIRLPLPTTRLSLLATGIVNGVRGMPLGVSTVDDSALAVDFSSIGATRARLIGLRDGVIVDDRVVPAGGVVIEMEEIVVHGCAKQPPRPPDPFPPFPCFIWRFEETLITPIVGAPYRADEIRVLAEDARLPITGLDSFSILGQGIGQFTMTGASFIAGCVADCDGDGVLDIFDFLCFQNQFATGDPRADCDGDGVLDIFDFLCFQDAFAVGCP